MDELFDMPVLSPQEPQQDEEFPPSLFDQENQPPSWNQIGEGKKRKLFQKVRRNPDDKTAIEGLNKYNREVETKGFDGSGWQCLSAAQTVDKYFHVFNFRARFLIINNTYPEGDYPEERLRQMFIRSVNYVKREAKEANINPNRWLVIMNSELMDHSVPLFLHAIDEDTPEIILHKFRMIDQSGEARGKDSLVTQEFVIQLAAFETVDVEKDEQGAKKARHPGRGRLIRDFKHHINPKAFIEVNNTDAYCLFRACLILRQRALLKNKGKEFYYYMKNEAAQIQDLNDMLDQMQIDKNAEEYDIETYGQIIQNYFDEANPGMFKIFAFTESGLFKPFWKSHVQGKFQYPISLLYWQKRQHYDAVVYPGKLFRESNRYCFSCEKPFRNISEHKFNCGHRCVNCLQIGPEFEGGCTDGTTDISCLNCHKNFKSEACYMHHLKSRACKRHIKCLNCPVYYNVQYNKRNGRDGHVCGETHCKKCLRYHGARQCFIRPFEAKEEKAKRFVGFDFECMTHIQPDPNIARFKHQVNMIVAHVHCSLCVKNGTWFKPLKEKCKICGDKRRFSWSPMDYSKTAVDQHFKTNKPLKDFVIWILTNFGIKKKQLKKKLIKEIAKATNKEITNKQVNSNPMPYFMDDEAEDMGEMDEEDSEQENDGEDSIENSEEEEEEELDENREEGIEDLIGGGDEEDEEAGVKPKEYETIAYSHNGGRYDNVIIFGEIIRMGGLEPKLIRQGNRMYEISVSKKNVINPTRFRDTYNIIPLPLAKFADTFDLKLDGIEGKQFFPYEYNRPENYNKTTPTLPDKKFYNADGMLVKQREKFDRWYEQNADQEFCLNEVIASYCHSDVDILVHGLVKMGEMWEKFTKMGITRSLTISSACMKDFQTTLEPNTLASTPHLGYEFRGNQSTWARKYLKWLEHTRDISIQHCDSPDGEFKYRGMFLDGYVKRDGERDLAIELNGCYYHACPNCYPIGEYEVLNGTTVKDIRERDQKKYDAIREEMDLEIVWECEVKEKMKKKESCDEGCACFMNIKTFFEDTPDSGPINLQEAFFGGRTGPEWMYSKAYDPVFNPKTRKRVMKFKDFVSLYPFINYITRYPIGHPKWKVLNKNVDWRHIYQTIEEGMTPFGIYKVWIVPPRHLPFPVVPNRFGDQRLLFSLCRTCAKQNRNGKFDPEYACPHTSDKERGFQATLTSEELDLAFRCNYRVTKIYRAYYWQPDQMRGDLFYKYVQKWMKLKYMSSGWPADILNPNLSEDERMAKKEEHLRVADMKYGIKIQMDEISVNPGLKYIAKMALNSLWGRFALRNRLSQTVLVHSDVELAQYLNNYKIDITYIEQLSKRTMMLIYKTKDEFIVENASSNVILALWTTAAARVHLMNSIMSLLMRTDVRILYMDTDSILYDYDEELGDPIPEGNQLGELSDVYPSHHIIEYVCAAPKAYSLMLKHKETGEISYETKCRGITIDCRNADMINHEIMRERVFNFMNNIEDDDILSLNYPNKFKIERRGEIYTVPMRKKFQCVINKGVLRQGGEIVPFGWSPYEHPKNTRYYGGKLKDYWNIHYFTNEWDETHPKLPKRKEQLDLFFKDCPRYHPITNSNPEYIHMLK